MMSFGGTKTSRSLMASQLVNKTMTSILDVWTCILAGWLAGRPEVDLQWICMDFPGFNGFTCIWGHFSDSGGWVPGCPVAGCGGLWRPVAESCGPFKLPYSVLGACRLAGWCLAGWLDGWMAGWKAPWMAGWLDGGHHSCNLARSSSRRVGG